MIINTATITKKEQLKEFATADLLETYNEISGEDVKKFRDRATAEDRTFKMIQRLAPGEDIRKPVKESVKKTATIVKPVQKSEKVEKEVVEDEDNRIIEVVIDHNPKRPNTLSFIQFGLLMKANGKTVADFKKEQGKHANLDVRKNWAGPEVAWAVKQGWIKLLSPKGAQRVA